MGSMHTMSSFDLTGVGGLGMASGNWVDGVGMLVSMEVGADIGLVTSA